jgi:hypothetical protein
MRQRSLQNLTWSQQAAHFLRHANGRPQATQGFVGSGVRWPRRPVSRVIVAGAP